LPPKQIPLRTVAEVEKSYSTQIGVMPVHPRVVLVKSKRKEKKKRKRRIKKPR
jgi:hypothetical protein